MTAQQRTPLASIATDEDTTIAFVLVDDVAPTAEDARVALLAQAGPEWGISFDPAELLPAEDAKRRSYKYEPGNDVLVPCDPDDPERDSEWWSFSLPEWEWIVAAPKGSASDA